MRMNRWPNALLVLTQGTNQILYLRQKSLLSFWQKNTWKSDILPIILRPSLVTGVFFIFCHDFIDAGVTSIDTVLVLHNTHRWKKDHLFLCDSYLWVYLPELEAFNWLSSFSSFLLSLSWLLVTNGMVWHGFFKVQANADVLYIYVTDTAF